MSGISHMISLKRDLTKWLNYDILYTMAKNKVIEVKNYERYWLESKKDGHQLRIVKQNGDTIQVNMRWPKGYYPRLRPISYK